MLQLICKRLYIKYNHKIFSTHSFKNTILLIYHILIKFNIYKRQKELLIC